MIEFALAAPMLVIFLLGALDTGIFLEDKVVAGQAVRQGARLTAELGGTLSNPTATLADIDCKIVAAVKAITSSLHFASVNEVDIYQVSSSDGSILGGDLVNKYDLNCTQLAVPTFPLSSRVEIPPNETLVGVRLLWVFSPPNGVAFGPLNCTSQGVFRTSPWRVG